MNGTASCGERVVIVQVQNGSVKLKTGHICSEPLDPTDASKPSLTIVRGDQKLRPVAESPTEAYEKTFATDDIHLLKEQEARTLNDPSMAREWFGHIYQDNLVTKIHRALKKHSKGNSLPAEAPH